MQPVARRTALSLDAAFVGVAVSFTNMTASLALRVDSTTAALRTHNHEYTTRLV
jgi:hypothetical protein